MLVTSLVSAAALLFASSEALALEPRQLAVAADCSSGNDAIDSLISSTAILQALCASVIPIPTISTSTKTVQQTTQTTLTTLLTDTVTQQVVGSTKTSFVTASAATTRTVKVTSTTPAPIQTTKAAPPVTSNPAPPVTSNVPPTSTAPPAQPSTSIPASPPVAEVPACDAVGYSGATPAYNFDGSGLNGNYANCSSLCKADTKCLSFGYGNNACLLFNITDTNNVNLVAGSPYRFFNRDCPTPVVARENHDLSSILLEARQLSGGTGTISGFGTVIQQLTSVCNCVFGSTGGTVIVTRTVLTAQTVTLRSRTSVTIQQTTPVTVTMTRQTVNTVVETQTVYVQADPTSTSTSGGTGSTFQGGVGI